MSKQKIVGALVTLGLCILLVVINNVLFKNRISFAQANSLQLAQSFTVGMLHKDQRLLKNIVIPKQHDELTSWLKDNRRYYCRPTRINFPQIRQSIYIKELSRKEHSVDYSALYTCRLGQSFKGLNFQIYQLTTTQVDGKWYIQDWTSICKSPHLAGCG